MDSNVNLNAYSSSNEEIRVIKANNGHFDGEVKGYVSRKYSNGELADGDSYSHMSDCLIHFFGWFRDIQGVTVIKNVRTGRAISPLKMLCKRVRGRLKIWGFGYGVFLLFLFVIVQRKTKLLQFHQVGP